MSLEKKCYETYPFAFTRVQLLLLQLFFQQTYLLNSLEMLKEHGQLLVESAYHSYVILKVIWPNPWTMKILYL